MKPQYLKFDATFEKKFAKYIDQLTETKRLRLKKKLEIFKENIFDKRLKTHKLKGELGAYHAFTIDYSDRIVFKILNDGGIYFIEIGSHDICY